MAQPFVFMELSTHDASEAIRFYQELFDWTFQSQPVEADYRMFRPELGPAGAIYSAPDVPSRWLPYINVADIQASTERAQALGATLVRGVQEIPGHGWTSIVTDPWGAPIALFQNAQA